MTPSPDAPEVCEISDIPSSHMDDIEEYIRIYDIEEKLSFNFMRTFSSDSPLNYVQNLLVIASESEEEFDLSPSNVAAGVQISNTLYIFEVISDCRSDPFSLLDLYLLENSYRIACTNTQNFEEGENFASTMSVAHAL